MAKFQKTKREDYESGGDSDENYDPEGFRGKLRAEEMPKGKRGVWYMCYRSSGVGRREHNCFDTSWPTPRLDERKRQADGQKHAPTHQNYAGLLNLENAQQQSSTEDQKSHLNAPKCKIRKPQRCIHVRPLTSRL